MTRSRPYGLCHRPYTKAYIKGFGSSYLHVYACLLLCFILVLASLVLGFARLDAFSGFVVVWLHPTPIRPCLDVTMWDASPWCQLLRAYLSPFPLHAMTCLHVCLCHPLAFYASLHACLRVHAWVLFANVSSILQHNEVMDIRSKPTFVPRGHHLLFAFSLVCLLACLLAFLFLCLPCLSCLFALCLFHMLLASFPSTACLLVSCLYLCMYIHGARTYGVRARSLKRKQKGHGCKHVDMSRATMFSRFRVLASPFGLCTFLNPPPLPSSLISLLDELY